MWKKGVCTESRFGKDRRSLAGRLEGCVEDSGESQDKKRNMSVSEAE